MAESSLTDAYGIGRRYEDGLDAGARRRGAHFTPPDVAERLVAASLTAWPGPGAPIVCDPSCGGGVFLVAAADALADRGVPPETVVERNVVGVDIDPGAARAATAALRAWAAGRGVVDVRPRVLVADALAADVRATIGPVDIVVGNPPFQNQLGGATARTAGERTALSDRFGAAVAGYVDIAALFQLLAVELVGSGGVVTLIQPRSFLVARDATVVRDRLLESGRLRAVWLPGESLFEAKVDVCATVVQVGDGGDGAVVVLGGRDVATTHGTVPLAALRGAPTWSPVWAVANGIPGVESPLGADRIGSIATATAGFRDQYYGLLDHLHEDEPTEAAPLVTTAMIDPARCAWGRRPVTIARQGRTTPWIDLASLRSTDDRLGTWVDRLLVPKVLVATQTKVIEAVADAAGSTVPFTPVIAVVPTGPVDAAHLEAALLAPAATAWAMHRFGGAGMSAGALKLAAKQVLEIPLPIHRDPWDEAVALLRPTGSGRTSLHGPASGRTSLQQVEESTTEMAGVEESTTEMAGAEEGTTRTEGEWRAFGRLMNAAWGLDDDLLVDWWLRRLPNVERKRVDPIH